MASSLLASCFGASTRYEQPLLLPLKESANDEAECQENPLLLRLRPPRRPAFSRPADHPANANDDNKKIDDDVVDVWILAGQSNCTGWNGADGTHLDPPLAHPPDDGTIRMLSASGDALVPAREPSHLGYQGFGDRLAVGPGLPFALALRARRPGGRPVVLVPCARGGASLRDDWSPDAPDDGGGSGGSLFGSCVRRAARAVELASAAGPGGGGAGGRRARLRGMVWVQGESDGASQASAVAYAHNFALFLRRLGQALVAAGACPSRRPLPIVLMAAMAARERERAFPFLRIVRDEQLWLAAKAAEDAAEERRRRRRGRHALRGGARGAVAAAAAAAAKNDGEKGGGRQGDPTPPSSSPFEGVRAVDMAGHEFYPDGGTARGSVVVDGNLVHLTKDGAVALGTALGLLGAAAEDDEDEEAEDEEEDEAWGAGRR